MPWTTRAAMLALALFAAPFAKPDLAPPLEAQLRGAQDHEVLARTRALYPTLKSYADSGTVTEESTDMVYRGSFKTRFRNPLDFYFEYTGGGTDYTKLRTHLPDPRHQVLWMRAGELQTWDKVSQMHETVPRESGRQVSTLVVASVGSHGTAGLVPSLIFAKANIKGPVQEFTSVASTSLDMLGGRRTHKVTGIARSVYPSGQVTNVRPIAVWIDVETGLIRQVFEDTPKGYPLGQISRRTITYEPQLNPPLDDSAFDFKVPIPQP